MAALNPGIAPRKTYARAQIVASTACRQVVNKAAVPMTTTKLTVGWGWVKRSNAGSVVCLIVARPKTWMSTVSTINGNPQAQSEVQVRGTSTRQVEIS